MQCLERSSLTILEKHLFTFLLRVFSRASKFDSGCSLSGIFHLSAPPESNMVLLGGMLAPLVLWGPALCSSCYCPALAAPMVCCLLLNSSLCRMKNERCTPPSTVLNWIDWDCQYYWVTSQSHVQPSPPFWAARYGNTTWTNHTQKCSKTRISFFLWMYLPSYFS